VQLRRHKDIVAFRRKEDDAPLAFHARNLELAEISEELWQSMTSSALSSNSSTSSASEIEELEDWHLESNPEVRSGHVELGIRSLTINVTQICNLKCTYCAAGGDGTYGQAQAKISVEKTIPQLKYFLDKVPSGGAFRITFLGGEPLLYPEGIEALSSYVRMATAGRNIKVIFSIVTNGTLFNEKTLAVLKTIKANVTVSLDGPAQYNDVVRPLKNGSGSTHLVEEGLKRLLAEKESLGKVTIHGVFHQGNMQILEAYRFYQGFAVDKLEFTYGVSEKSEEASQHFVEQMNAVAAEAYAKGGESALRKIALFDQYFSALDQQQQTENFCGAGKSYLMIDARNNVFTCPWDVGNKSEQVGQGAHVDETLLKPYEQALIEKNNCQNCWARYLCGGGCMFVHKQSTGEKNKKDQLFCDRTRSLILTSLFYYKQSRTPAEDL